MGWILDGVYGAAMIVASPWLMLRSHRRRLLPTRIMGKGLPDRPDGIVVWFHGVSVGEIILLETLLKAFQKARPDVYPVVSTSTDTGMAEAIKRHGAFHPFPFPFDFSFAVEKALRQLKPDLIVLAESELWPNFLNAVHRHKVPLAVINARMSPRSLKRWKMARFVTRQLFSKIDAWAVQQPDHGKALIELGVPPERVEITGSVKFDHAVHGGASDKVQALRSWLALQAHEIIWVAGSTQPTEEQLCLETFQTLRKEYPTLRLVLVPRDASRGGEIARLAQAMGYQAPQRSMTNSPIESSAPVSIVDTIGELGALWNLATLAFVGGSLDGKRGGQNMIEPASQGLVPVFGPHVWNFQAIAKALLEGNLADQVQDGVELTSAIRAQLANSEIRAERGMAAKRFVLSQQGATERTVAMLIKMLPPPSSPPP